MHFLSKFASMSKQYTLIDTHSHLYHIDFEQDMDEILSRCRTADVSRVYLPAIDSESHGRMMALAKAEPAFCIPMMGLHPCSVEEDYQRELELVKNWLDKENFAAIGEIGLDYYHSTTFKQQQIEAFGIQIAWALEKNLPIVIHSRSSMDDCIKMIGEHGKGKLRGIFHCFGGDERQARKIVELGFMLGIGGVVTYKNAGLAKVVEEMPLETLVLETDAPYLTPVPFRGKRNESSYVKYVAEKVAEIKGVSIEEVAAVTTKNAEKIFGS